MEFYHLQKSEIKSGGGEWIEGDGANLSLISQALLAGGENDCHMILPFNQKTKTLRAWRVMPFEEKLHAKHKT